MIEKRLQRSIKPKTGSKAKEWSGVFIKNQQEHNTPDELLTFLKGINFQSPADKLEWIISTFKSFLDQQGLPTAGNVLIFLNGSWESLPENINDTDAAFESLMVEKKPFKFCSSLSLVANVKQFVEPLSPEYFAMKGIDDGERALRYLEEKPSNLNLILESSMDAVDKFHRFLFASQWELLVLKGLSQQADRKPRDNSWAKEIARYLKKNYPDSTFREQWESIPDDEEWDGWAVEIEIDITANERTTLFATYVRDDNEKKKPQRIEKETFRTEYMTNRKKNKKK